MAKVGIVMGSDSDLEIMGKAADVLEELGVDYEMTIISAHRMPDIFFDYAKSAESKGMKVIIAGAGGAAHLPGMCAALFPMPVIGVPIHTKALGGVDSLYSIVQMPGGIPVATVAINGGLNAGLLAAKILATSDPELLAKLKAYTQDEAMKMLKWERRIEFGMESSRFFDLVRWGEAKDVINAYYVTEAARCSIYKNAGFTENKNEYLPIPFEQISASNGNYTQNFGW